MMWVATERASYLVDRAACCSPAPPTSRGGCSATCRPASTIWLDPWADRARQGLPDRPGAVRAVRRRHRRHRARPRQPRTRCPRRRTTSSSRRSARSSACSAATAVLIAYLLIIGAGLRTALRTDNTFEKLLAVGLTTIVGVQAFIIIGGVIKLVPLTGITLPFVSYGGSSLLSNYILLALLIRLSDSGARRLARAARRPDAGGALGGAGACAAATRRRRPASWSREPPDPPARGRPDGLLRRAVRRRSTTGRSGARRSSTPASTTPGPIRREFEQPRGPIVTADGVGRRPSRCENPPGSDFTYQRQYPTGDLFANVTGYYTFAFGSTAARAHAERRAHRRHRASSSCATCPALITGSRRLGHRSRMTLRSDLQQVAKDALGEREGSVVVMEPATGAVQAMWSYPTLRPQPGRRPRLRRRPATCSRSSRPRPATRCWPTPTSSATCRARRSRCSPPASPWRTGVIDLDRRRSPTSSEWVPPQTDDPIENFGGTPCGGDLTEVFTRSCNIPFAQMAARDRRRADGRTASPTWGVGEPIPIDLPRPAASTFGDVDDLAQNLPAAGDPRLRPERGPDGAAAHGDGRRHRRQRRRR